jgi:hypothetical protein
MGAIRNNPDVADLDTLYQQSNGALRDITRFRRGLRPDLSRAYAYRDFEQMDRRVHELLETVRDEGEDDPSLRWAANRIRSADHQLHYTLYGPNDFPGGRRNGLQRQVDALAQEAAQMAQTAQYDMGRDPASIRILRSTSALAENAERFRRALNEGADPGRVRDRLEALDQSWNEVAAAINGLLPQSHYDLRREADRVHVLQDRVHELLGAGGSRPGIQFD